jgi:hypothetical protein
MFFFVDDTLLAAAAAAALGRAAEEKTRLQSTDLVRLVSPTRERPAFDGIVGVFEGHSTMPVGFTSYYMLCPSLSVPNTTNFWQDKQTKTVLFFCIEPASKVESGESTYHFPRYDFARSALAIGDDNGEAFNDSQVAVLSSKSPKRSLSPSPSPSLLLSQPVPVPVPVPEDKTKPKQKPKQKPTPPALPSQLSSSLVVKSTEVPNPQSFFKSITNKFLSFFNLAKIGDHTQRTTVFIGMNDFDDLWLDKLWVRLLIEVADEVERDLHVYPYPAAAKHAHSSAMRLTEILDPLDDRSRQSIVDMAVRAADLAQNVAISAVASRNMKPAAELAYIAAFAARIVACVYACDRAEIRPSLPPKLAGVCDKFFEGIEMISSSMEENLNVAVEECFKHAQAGKETVIEITELALAPREAAAAAMDGDHLKMLASDSALQKRGRDQFSGRRRHYLHHVSSKRRRTLKKKNISRKYFKHSSGCDGTRRRSYRRRRRRNCYSRKITKM